MKICPACGSKYPDDANFCPMDASKLPAPVAAGAPPVTGQATSQGAATPPTAAIAGRFTPGDEIARTPTGVVYEARDGQSGETVALKLVEPRALPTAMMADRALRELKQLTKVRTDRILRVIDQGKADDGRVYIATERLGGATLEEIVERQGPLSFERAQAIVLAVGEALTEAQKVGVIHRDVSPRNVVVDGDVIKLIDFGLAEPVSDKVFGTPAFLSPEQAEGKPVDQRSNIYSLGSLFYYVLAGAPPFVGEREALVQQHLHEQPQAPSSKRAGVSPEIDKLVLKALEKSGGRRHLTLRQLLNEVGALVAPPGLAATTTPPPAAAVATPGVGGERFARTVMNYSVGTARTDLPDLTERVGKISDPALERHMQNNLPTVNVAIDTPQAAAARINPGMTSSPSAPTIGPMAGMAPVSAPAPAPRPQSAPMAIPVAVPQAVAHPPAHHPPVAAAAPPSGIAPVAPRPTAPVAAAPPRPAPASVAGQAPAVKKAAFRETAWFKKGELEEELAKAAAIAAQADPLAGGGTGPEAVVDEGSLTAEDRARLSLKTGRTEAMRAVNPNQIAPGGDRMSEREMLAEVDSSRRWLVLIGLGIAVLAIAAVLVYFLVWSNPPPKKAALPAAPTAVATSPPPAVAAPAAPLAALPAVPPTAPPPAAPPAPAAPPPEKVIPADALIAAEHALASGHLVEPEGANAVELLIAARDAGAKPKQTRKLEDRLVRALGIQARNAIRKRDRAGEAAALGGLLKLNPRDKAVRARLAKIAPKR